MEDKDTIRVDLPEDLRQTKPLPDLSNVTGEVPFDDRETIRIPVVAEAPAEEIPEAAAEEAPVEEEAAGPEIPAEKTEERPEDSFRPGWEPEYEQPMGDYVPPQPIIFRPKSRLHELKRKLVAGPEKRYYKLSEQGLGKLQAAIFLSMLVVVVAAASTLMYAMGMVQPERMKLMIFGQFFILLVSALLGCFQMMEGVGDLFKGHFSPNTMLVVTFGVCVADGIFCLRELRVPCCAAFALQVMMSLWGAYDRRAAEMAQMDTMRKAIRLDSVVLQPDFHDGCAGVLRGEGQVEDFMESYQERSGAEKVMSLYSVFALVVCGGLGVLAGNLHESVSFGLQVTSVSLLAAVPVTMFIAFARPQAILEKRLNQLGVVLCGWRGIKALSKRVVFPLTHTDLFPGGSCKLNGVKFYGDRSPDQIVAYAAAIVAAEGGGLEPLFTRLLDSRKGRHYEVVNMRAYGRGGLGGEVCGEPVLVGVASFMRDMGVEIPDGTRVNQAVYVSIDGELCGLFAVSYLRDKGAAMGLRTLCAYRGVRPVLVSDDFMLTEDFVRGKFGVNTRKIGFPEREVRRELAAQEAAKDEPGLALVTSLGLAPFAFAVTGARTLRSAWNVGLVIQLLGGILGLGIMAVLTMLGARELLTPANVLLYELVWLIPGLLVTEWTRSV